MPTIEEMLARGKACHSAGQLADAGRYYQEVIRADPANVEANYLLGAACHALGKAEEAIAKLSQAARLRPDHAPAIHHLGVVLAQSGRAGEAEACYRRTLELEPNDARAHNNLGALLTSQDKLVEAAACYQRALQLEPNYSESHNNLGIVLERQGNLGEAEAHYWRALELNPECADAFNNLGRLFVSQERLDDGVKLYRRALELRPDFVDAHNNLGIAFTRQGNLAQAIACCRRVLELEPGHAEAHNNLGVALAKEYKLDEATAFYKRALELRPGYAEAHHNLGLVLVSQGKPKDAQSRFKRAVDLKPDFADARFNYATTLLLEGRFCEAWPEYEWRWTAMVLDQTLHRTRWKGEELPEGTVLLHSEQGLGDTLQFVRYAQLVKSRVGRVAVECLPQLADLLATCPAVDTVVTRGDPLPEFDAYVPLLSLPGIFQTTLDTVPANVPYLKASEERIAHWKEEFKRETGFKIGIAWQGSRGNKADRARSFALELFAGIAGLDNVRLYSLQKGDGQDQLEKIAWPIIDLGDRLGDFYETAAIVSSLDLVITCDSAPAHLAGALGAKVWVALASVPDWRWMLEREDSPWYPTMRLFRQTRLGDWDGVFQRMRQALVELV